MIQEFQVANFHSIREKISISFLPSNDGKMLDYFTTEVKPGLRLLKIGIIYGANASGKTTVLEAVSFFREFMVSRRGDKLEGLNYSPFMLDNESRTRNTFMEMTFFIDGEKYIASAEFTPRHVVSEQLVVYTSSRPTVLYKRSYSEETGHSTIVFGTKIGLSKKSQQTIEGNTLNNCSVMAAFGLSNVEASRLDKVYRYFSMNMLATLYPRMAIMDYVKRQLKEASDTSVKSFILHLLKASDFNIVDFYTSKNADDALPDELIFRHAGDDGEFALGENCESAGTKRFMGMAIILYKLIHDNCFLPIDEIETSIHYELLTYFLKVFLANSEGTSQLLVTTHDINLLDEDFMRRDIVWFTVKNDRGATSLKRLTTTGLHKTLSVYNAYRQGKIVELPFLGSIFLEN